MATSLETACTDQISSMFLRVMSVKRLVPRWSAPTWLKVGWIIALAVLAALVATAQVLDTKIDAHHAKWIHSSKLQVGLVCALAVATLFDTLRRTFLRLAPNKRHQTMLEVQNQLAALIVTVSQVTDLEIDRLGAGLFLLRGRWLRRPEMLVRVRRVRLIDNLEPSDIQFTKGKGTVGLCWQHQRLTHHSWQAINAKYDGKEITEVVWSGMSEDAKHGFTKEDWTSLLGKYAEVMAVQVMVEGQFVGVLALDVQWNKEDASERSYLDTGAVKKPLRAYARTLEPILRG